MSSLHDPRVLFAAERTLLAWNRTAVSLMGFGFLVERFGLFLHVVLRNEAEPIHRGASLLIGVSLIVFAVAILLVAAQHYRKVLRTLSAAEIPAGYWTHLGVATNAALAVIGIFLAIYLVLL